MSQYFVKNEQGQEFMYGFDPPLSEYFMQQEEKTIVGTMSRPPVYGSHVNLLVAMQEKGVWDKIPVEHRQAIGGDLVF